jgi:hypothetical protein
MRAVNAQFELLARDAGWRIGADAFCWQVDALRNSRHFDLVLCFHRHSRFVRCVLHLRRRLERLKGQRVDGGLENRESVELCRPKPEIQSVMQTPRHFDLVLCFHRHSRFVRCVLHARRSGVEKSNGQGVDDGVVNREQAASFMLDPARIG